MTQAIVKWTGEIVDHDLFKNYFLPADASRLAPGSQALDLNWLRVFARKHQSIPAEQFIDFLYQAQRQGADPRNKEVYLVVRQAYNRDTKGYEPTATTVFAYQFFISRAMATGRVAKWEVGTIVEEYYNPVTNQRGAAPTSIARVWLKDQPEPLVYRARFWEFAQKGKDGVTKSWAEKPYLMLEKCAIANAMRWACPEILSGIYIGEEIDSEQARTIEMDRDHGGQQNLGASPATRSLEPGSEPGRPVVAAGEVVYDYTSPDVAPPKPTVNRSAQPQPRSAMPPPPPPPPPGAAMGKPHAPMAATQPPAPTPVSRSEISPSSPSTTISTSPIPPTTLATSPSEDGAKSRKSTKPSKELTQAREALTRWIDSTEQRKGNPNEIAGVDCAAVLKAGDLELVQKTVETLAAWTQARMDAAKQERETPTVVVVTEVPTTESQAKRAKDLEQARATLLFEVQRVCDLGGAPMHIIGGNPHNVIETEDLTLMRECAATLRAWRPKPKAGYLASDGSLQPAPPENGDPALRVVADEYAPMDDDGPFVPEEEETYDRPEPVAQAPLQSLPQPKVTTIAVDPGVRFGLVEAVNKAVGNGQAPADALKRLDPLLKDPPRAAVVLQQMRGGDYSFFVGR